MAGETAHDDAQGDVQNVQKVVPIRPLPKAEKRTTGSGRRRGNHEGTIVKRGDGRWMASLTLGNGKRKTFYASTRRDVQEQLLQARHDLERGLAVGQDARLTTGTFLDRWLAMKRGTVRAKSWETYELNVRLYLKPAFGSVPLIKLRGDHVVQLHQSMRARGRSNATIQLVHTVLAVALRHALRTGAISRNILDGVHAPRRRRVPRTTWTPEQARTFLATVAGTPMEALFLLALTTTMREAELLGLRWVHVDLESTPPTLAVVEILTSERRDDGTRRWVLSETKTEASRRLLTLTTLAVDALRRHRHTQQAYSAQLGDAWQDHGLVFPGPTGTFCSPNRLRIQIYYPLVAKAGVPRIKFHDLRHTAATLLLYLGIQPKIVSEMLGHSSVKTTQDVYSHAMPIMHERAAAALDTLLTQLAPTPPTPPTPPPATDGETP